MNLSASAFVEFLYAALFDRVPDEASVAHWVNQLREGATPLQVFDTFLATPEGHQRFAKNPYFARYFDPARPSDKFYALPSVAELMPELLIVDVGAMLLDFEDDVYRPLVDSGRCRVVGFEPIEEQRSLRERSNPSFTMLPYVIGDGRPAQFYRAGTDAPSSIYRPNLQGVSDFRGLREFIAVAESWPVETVRLDDLDEIRGAAYLKIDVQGAELDVLRGATQLLKTCPLLHLEVEFFPLYDRQPLIEDVLAFMRTHEFELFDLPHLERYHYADGSESSGWEPRRLLWADALCVASRDRLVQMPLTAQVHTCWVMHEVYRSYDFCRWLLRHVDGRHGTSILSEYQQLLES